MSDELKPDDYAERKYKARELIMQGKTIAEAAVEAKVNPYILGRTVNWLKSKNGRAWVTRVHPEIGGTDFDLLIEKAEASEKDALLNLPPSATAVVASPTSPSPPPVVPVPVLPMQEQEPPPPEGEEQPETEEDRQLHEIERQLVEARTRLANARRSQSPPPPPPPSRRPSYSRTPPPPDDTGGRHLALVTEGADGTVQVLRELDPSTLEVISPPVGAKGGRGNVAVTPWTLVYFDTANQEYKDKFGTTEDYPGGMSQFIEECVLGYFKKVLRKSFAYVENVV